MKTVALTAAAACVLGFVHSAQAQDANFFFEGDIVKGGQPGATGPFCVLSSQFKRMEKVVFRIRVLDATGKSLNDKGLKSLSVELPDGTKLASRFGAHPPPHLGPTTDFFWTSAWIVPDNYPSGAFTYKVVATGTDGKTQTWQPFKTKESQFTVLAATLEFK
jgi:hypothetical protein